MGQIKTEIWGFDKKEENKQKIKQKQNIQRRVLFSFINAVIK